MVAPAATISTTRPATTTLSGGDGDDTLQVLVGNNVLDGGTGTDFLLGGAGVDSYVLRAGGGIDTIVDNWYIGQNSIILVDFALRPDDVALTREDDGTGSCLVVSVNGGTDALWLRYAPAQAPVEIRFADGTTWDPGAIFDRLYVRRGTAGSDTLTAGLGDFQLFGYAGNDMLIGGAGNDLLDGGTGADSMTGGGGNDTYIVDDAGDVVVGSSPGYDTVKTTISYVLPANVESLFLVGASAINGTGNNLANKVVGNAGNNVLDGKAGADTLQGGAGNDTYVIDNAGDVVTENVGEGIDLVQSNITYSLGANLENLHAHRIGGNQRHGQWRGQRHQRQCRCQLADRWLGQRPSRWRCRCRWFEGGRRRRQLRHRQRRRRHH